MLALLPNQPLSVTALITLIGTAGGTAVAAQLGRELGRRKEPDLWKSWDGPPTTRLLRHRRTPDDPETSLRLRQRVERWLGYQLPDRQEEEACPTWADARYEEATRTLREATRDASKFPLVFAENINYGFRRNLLGLRPIGATIALALALSSWMLLSLTIYGRPWPEPWWDIFPNPDSAAVIRVAVATVDTILVVFWMLWVKPSRVKATADTYAVRLLESVQILEKK